MSNLQTIYQHFNLGLISYYRYVAFLSGLDIGDHNEDLMALQLMVDLLTGQLGDEGQQSATANIVRVVIAGNSLSQETQGKDHLSKVR